MMITVMDQVGLWLERIFVGARRIGMRRLRNLAAVAGLSLLAACGTVQTDDDSATEGAGTTEETTTGEASETAAPVLGTTWTVQEIETADGTLMPAPDTAASLQITDDGKVAGTTGCNGFGGNAEIGDGVITFTAVFATKMACSGEVGQIDSAMLAFLDGEVSSEVSGDSLTLINAAGQAVSFTVADDDADGDAGDEAGDATQ
jgi:heat shock protein HslJ